MLDETAEVLTELKSRGIRLYIVSGSIKLIVIEVLGELATLFDEIQANELHFSSGTLSRIAGTRYDFEGKANYLREIMAKLKLSPPEVLFFGNSCNDDWASLSGAQTVCINPRLTNPNDAQRWSQVIPETTSLRSILKLFKP